MGEMDARPRAVLSQAVGLVAVSLFVLALLEIPYLGTALIAKPWLGPVALLSHIHHSLHFVWMNALALMGWIALRQLEPWDTRTRLLAQLCLCALPVGYAYFILSIYRPFATHPPFIVALLGVWSLTSGVVTGLWRRPRSAQRSVSGVRQWGLVVGLLLTGVFLSYWDHFHYLGIYPTLHLTAFLLSHLALCLGLWSLLKAIERTRPQVLKRVFSLKVQAGLGTLVFLSVLLGELGAVSAAEPHVRFFTTAGSARTVLRPFRSAKDSPRGELRDDDEAIARFERQSNFPRLPAEFLLQDYNVLLVSSEATRFDRTSLSDHPGAQTPNLQRLKSDGAYIFENAYASSSGTLHSISALLGMTFTSMLESETYHRSWHGELLGGRPQVPEIFKKDGYSTFWSSHGHRDCFRTHILGLDKGFDDQKFFLENKGEPYPDMDRDVADSAIAELNKRARSDQRFFGWVFFGGPHADYQTHYPEMPALTQPERYLQELRFTDEQLGRVLDALELTGLAEKTIVIFLGDHGEEFREHGGRYHKVTLYREVLQVPLVVAVPGHSGHVVSKPVSTTFAIPWLMMNGTQNMRDEVAKRLSREIGPMLRETDGAVVAELLGHQQMFTTLIYEDYKIIYDFASHYHQIYDLRVDPHEQANLFDTNPPLAKLARSRIAGYLKVRSARAQYLLRPDSNK